MPARRSTATSRRATALLATSALTLAGLAYGGGVVAQAEPGGSLGATASQQGAPITDTGAQPFTQQATGLPDVDTRGQVAPLASQRRAVPAGASVRWNRYGTPASVSRLVGDLAGASGGSPVTAARGWLRTHRALFGLSSSQVDALAVVNDTQLTGSRGHAVLLRQQYGGLPAAIDGLVTVGLAPGNRVTFVSSSLSRSTGSPAAGSTISAVAAWQKAAADVGQPTTGVGAVTSRDGWSVFPVQGLAEPQRARLRALALPTGGVRPVYEANVVDAAGGKALAFTSYVDALTGTVLVRHNQVDNLFAPATTTAQPFSGTITATACAPGHDFTVDGATKSITASAAASITTNDITLKLLHGGQVVASADTVTSPETITYAPAAGIDPGTYTVQVCPFSDPTVPFVGPDTYAGLFTASEQDTQTPGVPYPPKWKYFVANPTLDFGPGTTDSRQVGCWVRQGNDCDHVLNNLAARAPWDVNQRTNAPTLTSLGNAADTAEAWLSPLTPGGAQRPVSPNRHYGFDNPGQDFTDAWNNTRCSPTAFTPANNNNDILASVSNLFSGHNRFHDFSYFLGFTEANYNLQDVNFGLTQPGPFPTGREGDPEVGNVQAGALTGGQPSFMGRDNANQITLQDGIPGITNQYLFQPIAGAFYSPCVDGDLDAPVYGHEYTHAISNRMVAGPDDGLSGFQAGSMGESWSDQVALEYLFEHHYDIGTKSPWVEGPYVTGNKVTGIRNYALDANPLQYGDLGYDVTGPEVHADGEVWSAAMFDVRRQLVSKYNARYRESNRALQLRCSMGNTTQQPPATPLPAGQCPGGRRWIQLMFDSFLLQQSGTSMLDARDAYLAADRMRFGGANQTAIWRGFAGDGMGSNAMTASTEDDQPVSGYVSPRSQEGTFAISALGFRGSQHPRIAGKLYVGDYEARVTPIADTDPATKLGSRVSMVPGTYDFTFAAKGYGMFHFRSTITAGRTTSRELHLSFNSASASNGATIDGSSSGLNQTKLIDDTEATNWAGTNPAGVSVDDPAAHPFVNVDLAGDKQLVRSVRVSAMLRPADPAQDQNPNQPDDESGSRFTALRQFAIEVCTEGGTSTCSSTLPSTNPASPYHRIYTSPADAFNGVTPRPLAPQLLVKRFDVPDTQATHVRLVALENQCTGQALYAGEQDADPANNTDCKSGSTRDESVRAAELEVFSYDSTTRPPGDPVVAMTGSGDPVAARGDTVAYTFSYRNLGPKTSRTATISIDRLPDGLSYVGGSGRVAWNAATRTVVWRLGDVPVNRTGTVRLTARVLPGASLGQALVTTAQFAGKLTYSPPAAVVTVVR